MIHPLIRGANPVKNFYRVCFTDSSPHTRGKLRRFLTSLAAVRFIPSYEGQSFFSFSSGLTIPIHPLIRGANIPAEILVLHCRDSSPHTRGKHSVFMRLSAALNTSLCNLHKCHSCLVNIFFQIIFLFFNSHHQRHSGSV